MTLDVLVFGAGIAGLWTARALRARGDSCAILEPRGIGGVQSIASQGIIHGGIKYALTGAASRASRAIARMPEVWHACLGGSGPLDLREVRILSDSQTLFTTKGIGAKLAGVAASKAIRTGVERIRPDARPDGFAGAPRSIDLYRVDEPVLEPASLMHALSAPLRVLRLAGDAAVTRDQHGVTVRLGGATLRARHAILGAGAGNGSLFTTLGIDDPPPMQRRPLHMTFARGASLPMLWAHAIGAGTKPVATITSQRDAAGRVVWYVGGELSETGIDRTAEEQIEAVRTGLARLVPWADMADVSWSTMRIDRAEPATATGRRPDEPFVETVAPGITVVWPTKLAFAPAVSERVMALVPPGGTPMESASLDGLERAPQATLPWDNEGLRWS